MLKTQLAQGNNGLTKTKYLTFGIEAASMRQAKPRLDICRTIFSTTSAVSARRPAS